MDTPPIASVAYSIGACFAAHGIGTIAYHAVRGIHRHGLLSRLFCAGHRPSDIPEELISDVSRHDTIAAYLQRLPGMRRRYRTGQWLQSAAYDWHVSRRIDECQIFHGWAGHCLRSMTAAKKRGAICVVERASAHCLTQLELVTEEFRRFGAVGSPFSPRSIDRQLREYEIADYIAVPSQFVIDSFVAHGVPTSKLLHLPFGVDTEAYHPPASVPDRFRAVFVGSVGLRKGVPYLLEAWRELELPDAELVLVGGIAADIEPYLAGTQFPDNVSLAGWQDDPSPYLAQASVFVFPSVEEGSALVSYEAMACGLPVIVSENTGAVVRDGVDGYVVPVRNVEALSDRILRLHGDAELRAELGRNARQRAEQFTWDAYGNRLVAEYEKLIH